MVWFLERGECRVACELRRLELSNRYEFAVQGPEGPRETLACDTPTEMIETFLRRHAELQAEGWRPSVPLQLVF
jgi:hypothetical protein